MRIVREILPNVKFRDNGKPSGFKLVIGDPQWLDALFQEVNRWGTQSAPDFITIDSADGGTGAVPMSLLDYA